MHLHWPCFPLALTWLAISFVELVVVSFSSLEVRLFDFGFFSALVALLLFLQLCWLVVFSRISKSRSLNKALFDPLQNDVWP
ncbi:hypothetical protein DFS34DRAFT_614691 [Phlyctochytrium arcticum]|nr:hypothetical protein DFS34DRAFT_614691 [Phlyctochytrium arcticum]